jgi:acyl-CoA synthetase (AMP-forming)/AMP-acid ligase II
MAVVITDILERNARVYGEETALVERDPERERRRTLTWRAFEDIANGVAHALLARGISKGDKVIHLLMNCLEWLPVYFGILKTGAWVVPLNFRFSAGEIHSCIDIAEGRAIFFGEEFADRVNTVRESQKSLKDYVFVGPPERCPSYAVPFDHFLIREPSWSSPPEVSLNPLDEAGLYFTSGTTGTPKPILLTHRNLESACITENQHHGQTHEDTFLCIPPLYHTGAKMHWFGSFIVGGKGIILKGVSPQWILESVSEEQATIVWLLVPWAQDILVAIENGDVQIEEYQLNQWRLMHIGAQPVPPSLIKNWRKVFPHQAYDTNYGLSESTGPGCVHLGLTNTHKVGAIGVPGFDWECRIVDSGLKDVEPGEPGELMVKGPGVMKAYYKNPAATAATLVNGWLLTGDVARRDEDGFIWLVERKKDVIITGGENIFPVEVEDHLIANENIQDAAVIGIPDRRLGEIAAAVIKVKPGKIMNEKDVLKHCDPLPRYKRPRKVFFDDVPRNPTGKIEKPKLRKKYAGMEESFSLDT